MFENELKATTVLSAFKAKNNEEVDNIEVITEQSLNFDRGLIRELFPKEAISKSSDEKVKALQMEIDLLRTINAHLYKFTVDKLISANNPATSSSVVMKKAVKNDRKRKKTSNFEQQAVFNKTSQNTHINIGSVIKPVNGFPKNKKRRKRNRNKIKNAN